jgi:hypothetical protein
LLYNYPIFTKQGETMNTKEIIEIVIDVLGVIVKHIGNNGDWK